MLDLLRTIRNCFRALIHYRNSLYAIRKILAKKPVDHIVLRNGIVINAPQNSNLPTLVEEIFFTQDYTQYFKIRKDDLVVDIGANVGTFSLFASTKTTNRIYAFEALPENADFLKNNIALNKIKNIYPVVNAVCGSNGTARLGLTRLSGGHYLCDANTRSNALDSIEVPAITLQGIFNSYKITKINFLKIDCEGSEGAIFQSTPDEYFLRIEKIAMEFHDKLSLMNHKELIARLKKLGYKTSLRLFTNSTCGYIYAWRKLN